MDTHQADLGAAAETLRMWVETLRVELAGAPSDGAAAPLPAPSRERIPGPSDLVQIAAPPPPPVSPPATVVRTNDVLREQQFFQGIVEWSSAWAPRVRACVGMAVATVLRIWRRFGPALARWAGRLSLAVVRWVGRLAVTAFQNLRRPRSVSEKCEHAPSRGQKRWARRVAVTAAVVTAVAGGTWTARASWSYWQALHKTGTAVLESDPVGSDVRVDGTLVGRTPYAAELPPGRHVVEFKRRRVTRTVTIDVTRGQSTTTRIDWSRPQTGRLRVQSNPIGARVIIDGRERGVTPLTVDDLAVGSHAVVLRTNMGSVRKTMVVRADRQAEISEAIYSGWLHVSSPIALEVLDGRRAIGLNDQSRVLLPPGPHTIRVQNRELGFSEEHRVDVKPGVVASIAIQPARSAVTVTSSLPADVLIDGERVGETPLSNYPVSIGTRAIVLRSASGGERRLTTTVTVEPVRVDIDFSKP
jgi:hypothetical protein